MKRIGYADRLSGKWVWGAVALVAVLVIGTVAAAETLNVQKYINNGYSSVGPIPVESVSNQILVLYTNPKSIQVNLKGKIVRFMDSGKRGISMSSLKKGDRVYVFQKKSEVIVVLLPKKEVSNDQ